MATPMALTPCRECGKDVSSEAPTCPHCGASAPARAKAHDWQPCPNCGSPNTRRIGPGLLGFASLMMSGCLIWSPILGWILAPVFFVLAFVFWIWALIPKGRVSFQCQACKQWFTVPKADLPQGS